MNIIAQNIILYLVLSKIEADKVSDEKDTGHDGKKKDSIDVDVARRFIEDMNDEEWHVSHLKENPFQIGKSECRTFSDQAKRYKKKLQNDGAYVNYVSADTLLFHEKDSDNEACDVVTEKDTKKTPEAAIETTVQIEEGKPINVSTNENSKIDGKEVKIEEKDKETTADVHVKDHIKLKQKAHRKDGDYLFSSVEYYDEETTFDASVCPDAVEVIELEIDQVRNYDVECEKILEWRSLE